MKNLLFVGMDFYEYEEQIIKCLRNKYLVDYFVDKNSFFIDHFHMEKLFQKKKEKLIINYQKNFLKNIDDKKFDYVFVIVGRFLKPFFLEELRDKNPNATFILYLWDDIKRVENYREVNKYYDRIYSFDPIDSQRENLLFLPLFYNKLNIYSHNDNKYDVFSAMRLHSDRENIVNELIEKYPSLKFYVFFISSLKRMILYSFEKSKRRDHVYYSRKAMSNRKMNTYMRYSKALLDIQFSSQIGLTMRTFDTLSVGKKLITTNPSVKYYDFYNKDNILIISRDNPVIPYEFLKSEYKSIDNSILNKYSLKEWLSVMLEGKKVHYLVPENPYGL